MSTLGRTLVIKGELRASEDVTIEGRIEGPVWCEGRAVTIAAGSEVSGDVVARDITVFGRASGHLIATDVIDIRKDAAVQGRVVSKRFILHDGAEFNGRAEPQHLDAAIGVARFHQQKRDAAAR
jgi:cytoskeletal protein CcmA (bactofilin family)